MRYDPSEWAKGPVRGALWTRREHEPVREFGWFLRYLALPAHSRHPNHVARELDRAPGELAAAARAWRWSERARAWETREAEHIELRARGDRLARAARDANRRWVEPVARLSRPERSRKAFAANIVAQATDELGTDAIELHRDADKLEEDP